MFYVPRAVTPKAGKPKLRFICSASQLVLYICVKFHGNMCTGIRVMTKGLTDRLRMERPTVDGWTDTPNNRGYYNNLWVAGSEKVSVAYLLEQNSIDLHQVIITLASVVLEIGLKN